MSKISRLDGYWINVDFCHNDMLNWLEQNIEAYQGYSVSPRLHGYAAIHEIYFRFERDLFHFQLRWGDEII